jgi:hypothetical protein
MDCGLVVRVPGYRSRGPGFDSRRYQIFCKIVDLERGPLSLVRIIEELLEWKNSGSGLENRDLTAVGIHFADHVTPSIRKVGTNFSCGLRATEFSFFSFSVSQGGEEGRQTIFHALCVFACPTDKLWDGTVSPVPILL